MKSIVVQLIFLARLGCSCCAFLSPCTKLEDEHINWRNKLSAEAEQAQEEGRAEEASKLYEA